MSRRHDERHAADRLPKAAIERPVFAGRLVVRGRRAVCHLVRRDVEFEAPAALLAGLARLCDGETAMSEVLARLGRRWDIGDLGRLIDGLAEQGVLHDARDLTASSWLAMKNPASPGPPVAPPRPSGTTVWKNVAPSGLHALLNRRASTRVFSSEALSLDKIAAILWSAYGEPGRRTVPSAGGLYPLAVHFVNLRATAELPAGIYRVGFERDGRVGFELIAEDRSGVAAAFFEPDMLGDAQGVVVLSADPGRTARKYGPRAALYVPLEAGHAAQNVLLASIEAGVAAVEVGGFFDDRLAVLLHLVQGAIPLTSLVVGAPPTPQARAAAVEAPDFDFQWSELELPFAVCGARIADEQTDWSWGRSPDPVVAQTKAMAEAQERWSATRPGALIHGRLSEIAGAVDPRSIVAYLPEQYARAGFPYRPFEEEASYAWKEGVDAVGGGPCAVLADLVYASAFLDRDHRYTSVSSSGMAAYPTAQGALERAVLELIERDAFMTAWLGGEPGPTIEPHSLPLDVGARLRRLRQCGVEVTVKDHTQGLVPVILVFAQSVTAGFTLTTSAAAYRPEEALDNALMEMEFGVAARLAAAPGRRIDPHDVEGPMDHMDLYAQCRYFRRADFLARGAERRALTDVGREGARDWEALSQRLGARGHRILWFDLTPAGAALHRGRTPLHIGRAIVPGLIPISFGYGQEPLATFSARRIAGRGRRRSALSKPASVLFPHPFG